MKKFLIAMAVAAFSAGSATAADMPRVFKAPPVITAPVPDWSGFYIGGNVGGVFQSDEGVSNFFQPTAVANSPVNMSANKTGITGGMHVGYNMVMAPAWVIGLEADAMWLNTKSGFCRGLDSTLSTCADLGRGFGTIESKTNWLSTVRGRVGWSFDRMMIYGTGGAAFGDVETNIGFSCAVTGCGNSAAPNLTAGTSSSIATGWAAGAGVEWMVSGSWMLRAEYLHADLGNVNGTTFLAPANCSGGTVCGMSYSRDVTFDMGRVGLSYKFGGQVVSAKF